MKSQIAKTSHGLIEYVLQGTGPLVLVCHGTSSNCYSIEVVKPLVEAGFSVLTPSRPGYSRTPLRVGCSAAQAAQALIALLDHLNESECSVVAISGGGPTGIALAAGYPDRINRLILLEAVSKPEDRPHEPNFKNQSTFYGPMHGMLWAMLGLTSRMSPRSIARQTLAIFSTHNPDNGLIQLTREDIETIAHFYQGHSSRKGALNDGTHAVGEELLKSVSQPTLVVHSREDNSVPFSHAEWSLRNIPHAELCKSGLTGHFFWVGPDFPRISQRMVEFLQQVST